MLPAPRHLARQRAIRCSAASLQPRGGTARHDAVAWGYARAADALGVDIIQKCEVTGIRIERRRGRRRRDDARGDRARRSVGVRRRRAHPSVVAAHGRLAAADREPSRCRRWCPSR